MVKPRERVPALSIKTVDGPDWTLRERGPEHFSMLVAYRGLHCPVCKTYLRELERQLPEFESRGVDVLALSSDDATRAEQTKRDWGLERLPLGYGLPIEQARAWGLFVSQGIKEGEPAEFNEPGLFLVKPDGSLYWSSVSSMPFARPQFTEVLGAIDFVVQNDYPARGEA